MTGKDFIDSMEYVDAQWVEEAENPAAAKRKPWIPVVSVAACLAIILGSVLLLPSEKSAPITPVVISTSSTSDTPPTPSKPQQYEEIHLSAEQVREFFSEGEIAGGTALYKMEVVEKGQELKINQLPDCETVTIYNRDDTPTPEDKEQLKEWVAPSLERMCDSLGIPVPGENARYHDYQGYWFGIGQSPYDHEYFFYIERSWDAEYDSGQYGLQLDGESVSVDPNQTNEEIVASLEPIKQKLFEIFGREFQNVLVYRNPGFGHGLSDIEIYYYDESAHPLNQLIKEKPFTDYIEISFDREDIHNEAISEDEYTNVRITYVEHQMDSNDHYEAIGSGKLISLEDAEELLYKGYVFASVDCSECHANQLKVDFSDYDYVSYEYVEDAIKGETDLVVPFYAFYKKMKEEENGVVKYYKTYVCAVEVPDLEEYFTEKSAEHHSE